MSPDSLHIPTIDGARVRLEPLGAVHGPGMFELWSDPKVCRHAGPAVDSDGSPIELPAAGRRDSDRLLADWTDRAAAGTGLRWAVILGEGSRFVGAVGFNALGPTSEYAYHFIPRFWGSGLASEASRLALAWAFRERAEAVEVFIEPANRESLRLVERLGFARSGRGDAGTLRSVLREPVMRSERGAEETSR